MRFAAANQKSREFDSGGLVVGKEPDCLPESPLARVVAPLDCKPLGPVHPDIGVHGIPEQRMFYRGSQAVDRVRVETAPLQYRIA